MRRLFYFGCLNNVHKGHYLHVGEGTPYLLRDVRALSTILQGDDENRPEYLVPDDDAIFWKIDGGYTSKETTAQGLYLEHVVHQFRIVAWHDYTGDSRPNSNSALLGFGYENSNKMLDDMIYKFPTVIGRQCRPILFSKATMIERVENE